MGLECQRSMAWGGDVGSRAGREGRLERGPERRAMVGRKDSNARKMSQGSLVG